MAAPGILQGEPLSPKHIIVGRLFKHILLKQMQPVCPVGHFGWRLRLKGDRTRLSRATPIISLWGWRNPSASPKARTPPLSPRCSVRLGAVLEISLRSFAGFTRGWSGVVFWSLECLWARVLPISSGGVPGQSLAGPRRAALGTGGSSSRSASR